MKRKTALLSSIMVYDFPASMEYWQIGMVLEENLNTIGDEQPSGNWFFAISQNDRTSLTASVISHPHSNSNITRLTLSLLVELIYFRLSTEVKLFSMILETFVSISEAEAPDQSNKEPENYATVEQKPMFNGEDAGKFGLWVFDNIKYPEEAYKNGAQGS